MRLQDKVTIITGGASGMGRVAARMFAAEGAKVVVADVTEPAATSVVDEVTAAGGRAVAVVADVSKDADARRMVDEAVAAFGRVDVLYNNAGIMPEADHSVIDTSVEDWDRVMAVNVRAHFLGCKNALATMSDGGAVVLIGSVSWREVMPWPAYAASKAALESLCRQAAVEGSPAVRTNLLHPGLMDTSIGRLASQVSPLRDKVFIPARRQGTGWEVAYGALFLLSGESSYVTGQSLTVDGGLTVGPRAIGD
jgi:NAD(P)-dependent dehydrogenase (short-subunit alcohol dehydrogenase family)